MYRYLTTQTLFYPAPAPVFILMLMQRCVWATTDNALMCRYHDTEWGVPLHDDHALFEFLCLEGIQAGLSWRTVLARRAYYRKTFHQFHIARVASMKTPELEKRLRDPGIIRNRRKIYAIRDNAQAALCLINRFGSLDAYLWSFVTGKPIINHWQQAKDVPTRTTLSAQMSRALKKQGFSFVGPTICYALMQATGMVNDHLTGCFRHRELACHDNPAAAPE